MPNYRRIFVAGGDYFFTVNLLDRHQSLLTEHIGLLRAAYGHVQKSYPFETVAICVLPDHLHCVWRLPPGDADYPLRWRLVKSRFSKLLPRAMERWTPGLVAARASGGYGKGVSGNTSSVTQAISIAMWITFIGIP